MEESKLLALHDGLAKYQNKKKSGLGVSNVYNFAGSKTKQNSDSTTKVRDDGLPNNNLYINFVREGTYDPTQESTTADIYGDGRIIKRNFEDCITEVSASSNNSEDDSDSESERKKKFSKEQRKALKKEEKKAKKKAAKLAAKKQAKLEAKLALKRQQAKLKEEIASPTTSTDKIVTNEKSVTNEKCDNKIDDGSSTSIKKSKKRKKSKDDSKECENGSKTRKKSKKDDNKELEIKISESNKESKSSKKIKKDKKKKA